jgi:hypothetical protein
MLRVARRAVVVIEPHEALVARFLGTTWEEHGGAVNYVFRWSGSLFASVVKSQLGPGVRVEHVRLWDHPGLLHRAVARLPRGWRLSAVRLAYGVLAPFNRYGNMMVGVAIKRV